MDFKRICKKKKKFLGVPPSGPLENVENYFSKIDINIFAIDTIFLLQTRFILTKRGCLKKERVQTVMM